MPKGDAVYVHDYLGVDYDIVWEVVTADLPALAGRLERIE